VFYTVRASRVRYHPCKGQPNQSSFRTKDIDTVMPTTVESIGPCRKRVQVNVEPEKIATAHDEILREVRKVASIPGFRPGKAPDAMVQKKYGDHINEQVQQRVIPETFRAVLAEHKLRVIGQPQITKVDYTPGLSMSFEAELDTAPEFPLPVYKGISVSKKKSEVTPEDVDQTLEAMREQYAEFVDVEGRTLANGDYAVLSYTGTVDGKPIKEVAADAPQFGEVKDIWLPIQPDAFLPGFTDQLVGAAKGDKREVTVDIPADFAQKDLAGKKATYSVEISGIKGRQLPGLDDEFAKKAQAASLDELKENIRKMIELDKENSVKSDMRRQVMDWLLAQVTFDLPEGLVQQETRSILGDVVRQNVGRGATKEQLESQKDEILGFADKSARERLKGSFILGAIAAAEKIEATADDVNERVEMLARANRTTPDRLRAQLEKNDNLDAIEEQIVMSKTIDFLLANATVEPAKE
jgi:trigger factor